jgi:hypothetical protein
MADKKTTSIDLIHNLFITRKYIIIIIIIIISIESKNEIKLGRFHLKEHNFSVCTILGHPVYIPQPFPNVQ